VEATERRREAGGSVAGGGDMSWKLPPAFRKAIPLGEAAAFSRGMHRSGRLTAPTACSEAKNAASRQMPRDLRARVYRATHG
jgi:hypothetical protein